MSEPGDARGSAPPPRFRCRCGHLPTQHMAVLPIDQSGSFRLSPSGPCELCGPGLCPAYVPAGRPSK